MTEVDNKSLDHLYAWIDTIPLTRPKKSIARDFADGVLVAEVVAHFFPKLVELHNYCNASSNTQKRINWQTLNRRVFSKMGMRIGEDIITHLIEAKQGIIEQVLWDIRSKIENLVCTSDGKLNSNRRIKSATGASQQMFPQQPQQLSQQSLTNQLNRGNPYPPPPQTVTIPNNEPQLTYRVAAGEINSPSSRGLHKSSVEGLGLGLDSPSARGNTRSTGPAAAGAGYGLNSNFTPQTQSYGSSSPPAGTGTDFGGQGQNQNNTSNSNFEANLSSGSSSSGHGSPELKKYILPAGHFTHGFVVPPGSHQTQGYVAPPLSDTSLSPHGNNNGPIVLSPIVDKNDNVNTGGPPAQIIYRGHKMIPLQFLDDKEKEIKALETSNRSLTLKIHRLETLVNVKDQRIEDLTHQLQNLRSMYERVTENTYTGGAVS